MIQGAADADPRLTEQEIQDTMEFCKNIFAPTDPRMHAEVAQRLGADVTSPYGPIIDVQSIDRLAGGDAEAGYVLREVNARKPIHLMYDTRRNFGTEVLAGFCVRMEKGMLGLVRV